MEALTARHPQPECRALPDSRTWISDRSVSNHPQTSLDGFLTFLSLGALV